MKKPKPKKGPRTSALAYYAEKYPLTPGQLQFCDKVTMYLSLHQKQIIAAFLAGVNYQQNRQLENLRKEMDREAELRKVNRKAP